MTIQNEIESVLDELAAYSIDGECNWQEIVRWILDNSDTKTLQGIKKALEKELEDRKKSHTKWE